MNYCIFKHYKFYLLKTSKIDLNVISTGYISNLPAHILKIPTIFIGSSLDVIWPRSKPTFPCIDIVSNRLLNGS